MKMAWVYVNTSKPIGHKDHIKVFANQDVAEKWFEENDSEGTEILSTGPRGLLREPEADAL